MSIYLRAIVALAVAALSMGPCLQPDEDRGLPAAAERDGRRFLATYVADDGRVVRTDQGGDTVSEGQAYALLVAVALDDRETFALVWSWTAEHLRRPDGLLSWRWADGAVLDPQSATDADLDAAWALALAERRWPDEGYGQAATVLARAVEAHETVSIGGGRWLVAGPWARPSAPGADAVVNPGYFSPVADAVLVRDGRADPRATQERSATMRSALDDLLHADGLPPDWARVSSDGRVRAVAGPSDAGGPGRFGFDAVRVPLRLAGSCAEEDVALAARLWPSLEDGGGRATLGDHPARAVAGAAAAAAADEPRDADELLDRASAADRSAPTYYGSALTALARLLLTTDRLDGCPPLP